MPNRCMGCRGEGHNAKAERWCPWLRWNEARPASSCAVWTGAAALLEFVERREGETKHKVGGGGLLEGCGTWTWLIGLGPSQAHGTLLWGGAVLQTALHFHPFPGAMDVVGRRRRRTLGGLVMWWFLGLISDVSNVQS